MPRRSSGSRSGGAAQPGEIYIEFQHVGRAVRVAAVDAATGTEVVVMGPAAASQADLQDLAVRKLKAQMAKATEEKKSPGGRLV